MFVCGIIYYVVKKKKEKTKELYDYDLNLKQKGYNLIAGMDEAGRGCLAGPVVVASVIMPLDFMIDGINDSKKITPKKREELYSLIVDNAIAYSIVFKDNNVIDEINILNATKLAMVECVDNLTPKPDIILIDAVKLDNINTEQLNIVKGDSTSYNIAAASILAKVTRDRYISSLSDEYNIYNFSKHKGYGTKEHIELLNKFGASDIHRKTFIKNIIK